MLGLLMKIFIYTNFTRSTHTEQQNDFGFSHLVLRCTTTNRVRFNRDINASESDNEAATNKFTFLITNRRSLLLYTYTNQSDRIRFLRVYVSLGFSAWFSILNKLESRANNEREASILPALSYGTKTGRKVPLRCR